MPRSEQFLFQTRWRLVLAVALIVVSAQSFGSPATAQTGLPAGNFDRSLEVGGRSRTYHVHVPAGADSSAGLPVLVMLHGGGGNGKHAERVTGFSQLADEAGFIAVYPDGTGRMERRLTWNAANCCAYAHEVNVDDVGFIDAMLDALSTEFAPDMSRVYLTGHSNGGMMTYRLGCQLAGRFAAIAPVAGALNEEVCEPSRPVPMLIIHGEEDQNVPFAGGQSSGVGASGEDSRIDQPVSHAFETWVAIDGCAEPVTTTSSEATEVTTYAHCDVGTVVRLVVVLGWGHPWPGPQADPPSTVDASQLVWEFVSSFSIA